MIQKEYFKSCDWAALCWFAFQRARDGESRVCAGNRAFSQELPPEIYSRVGRVTPLWVWGVSAPEKRAVLAANAGGTAEGSPFVPILGWKVFFYTKNDLS